MFLLGHNSGPAGVTPDGDREDMVCRVAPGL